MSDTHTDELMSGREARIVLGLRDSEGVIPVKERSREALLVTIELLQNRLSDTRAARAGAEEVLLKRLKKARDAKRLANSRADRAEKAMRGLLDTFAQEEQSS